jgi:mono/diheme cytochrome c family protein
VLLGLVGLALLASFLRHRGDWPLELLVAEVSKELAVPREAAALQAPAPLTDRRVLNRGREAYTGSCAVCHGASGDGQGLFGKGLYPEATDFRAHDTQEKSDGQLFWIIKNGLSFGGMPAFADQYNDDETWAMVGYIRSLKPGGAAAAPPLSIAAPTAEEIAFADPHSSDAAARGAAVYMEQGCQRCHGARGVAPGDLGLNADRRGMRNAADLGQSLDQPPGGMPRYTATELSPQERADLLAYLQTFPARTASPGRGG